jgi:P27 family predicted phage terminase small subunit
MAKPKRWTPPEHFGPDATEEWWRIYRKLRNSPSIDPELDRSVLSAYCQAYERWVQAERLIAEQGIVVDDLMSPAVRIANRALADLTKYAAELGLTPKSRQARLAPPKQPRIRPLGKKEQAREDALHAAEGTDWSDDLKPLDYRII